MSTLKHLHLAAQYLAMAGKSFMAHREDDSETNLGWDSSRKSLTTHSITGRRSFYFELNVPDFALRLSSKKGKVLAQLPLARARHGDVLSWMNDLALDMGLDAHFSYALHYELPYAIDSEDFVFPAPDQQELKGLADILSFAQKVLETSVGEKELSSPLRVWPHHFDLGALVALGRDAAGELSDSIGVGLAIPDGMVDDFYFYVSPWSSKGSPSVEGLPAPGAGAWMHPSWNGGVLALGPNSDFDVAVEFYSRAFAQLAGLMTSGQVSG